MSTKEKTYYTQFFFVIFIVSFTLMMAMDW